MNKEKELLLKLLMEKYEDGDCRESNVDWRYPYYVGSMYEVKEPEPEVWESVFVQYYVDIFF